MEKLGRNYPCYCGSGKKYKKCCMEKDIENYEKTIGVESDSKEKLCNQGIELYEKERFGEAIDVLLKAYERDPHDIEIILLLAGCYVNIAHFADAIRLLLDADKFEPNNPLIKYNLGYALLCMGRLNDAKRYLHESLQLNPPDEIKEMAEKMIKSEDFFAEKLENNYTISLEEELKCEEKFRQAQMHLYAKRFEEAIALYNFILERKQNFHQAIQNIGVCYIQDGKPQEALKYLEKALNISPKDDLCLGNLAHAYYLLGNVEKSKEYSEKVMDAIKDPLLRDLIRLVTLFIEIKQFEFARKLLTNYRDVYDNIQLTFLSGVLYAKQKEYPSAKKEFQSISKSSRIAKEYIERVEQLIDGKINEYDFKLKMAIDANEEMI